MIITSETSLENFEFWGGAKDLADMLSHKELEIIEELLEDSYPEGMRDTEINDFFAYEGETIAEWLGYEKEDDILMRDSAKYLLDRARDLLEEGREDNLSPEFCLDDEEVMQFLKDNNMSEEEFVNEGVKLYIGILIEAGSMDEVDDSLSDYEDTIDYIRLEHLDKEIKARVEALYNGEAVKDLEDFRDVVTEKLQYLVDTSYKNDKFTEKAEHLIDDMERCDDFVNEEYERE